MPGTRCIESIDFAIGRYPDIARGNAERIYLAAQSDIPIFIIVQPHPMEIGAVGVEEIIAVAGNKANCITAIDDAGDTDFVNSDRERPDFEPINRAVDGACQDTFAGSGQGDNIIALTHHKGGMLAGVVAIDNMEIGSCRRDHLGRGYL
ncbi:MAG: hypothetical protein ACD_75C02430G0001, partial [uncultured bacterium]